jgi:hypothetical protein
MRDFVSHVFPGLAATFWRKRLPYVVRCAGCGKRVEVPHAGSFPFGWLAIAESRNDCRPLDKYSQACLACGRSCVAAAVATLIPLPPPPSDPIGAYVFD